MCFNYIFYCFSPDDDASTEPLVSLPPIELEAVQKSAPEAESAMESIGEPVNSIEVQTMHNPNASFFNRFVDMVVNINEITGHIGKHIIY